MDKDSMIQEIIDREWEMFDKTNNIGGRAPCQENKKGFIANRMCQFLAWNEEMLASYLEDLKAAKDADRNLLVEKYARMMKPVYTTEYNEIAPYLPTIEAETADTVREIVEMQMEWFPDFKQRVLLNSAKAYVRQLPKGNNYKLLQPVYALSLVNETFEPDMEEYYHYYHLVHDLHSDKVLDGLHLVFVELPKFKAKNFAEKKMQALWLRFLTEIDRDGADEVSQDLLDNPQTGQALEIVRESGMNDAERAAYEGFWDRVSIETTKKSYLAEAEAKLGVAVAERDAAVEKLRQTARNLKAMNLTTEQIADATGLTAAEIAAI